MRPCFMSRKLYHCCGTPALNPVLKCVLDTDNSGKSHLNGCGVHHTGFRRRLRNLPVIGELLAAAEAVLALGAHVSSAGPAISHPATSTGEPSAVSQPEAPYLATGGWILPNQGGELCWRTGA